MGETLTPSSKQMLTLSRYMYVLKLPVYFEGRRFREARLDPGEATACGRGHGPARRLHGSQCGSALAEVGSTRTADKHLLPPVFVAASG